MGEGGNKRPYQVCDLPQEDFLVSRSLSALFFALSLMLKSDRRKERRATFGHMVEHGALGEPFQHHALGNRPFGYHQPGNTRSENLRKELLHLEPLIK